MKTLYHLKDAELDHFISNGRPSRATFVLRWTPPSACWRNFGTLDRRNEGLSIRSS